MRFLKYKTLLLLLLGSAFGSTGVALFSFEEYACHATICAGSEGSASLFLLYSVSAPIAATTWFVFGITGVVFWRNQRNRNVWKKAGLDKNVYDLMVKMRGGNSRLELLRNLESPRQRSELSHLTGMDWKEVDRQVNLLQSYGLVSVYAESGSVKMFKLTEQGHLFLKLMRELNQ